MKTKIIEVCDAIVYSVACKRNDPDDIKCGGSPVLGYDFGVSPDESIDDITEFLSQTLKKFNRPFMSISYNVQKNFPIKHLWSKERMEDCIKTNNIY